MDTLKLFASKEIILKRNEYLGQINKRDSNVYFIESGSVKVCVQLQDAEQIVRFGYPGNFLVYLDSFLSGAATKFIIQAIKETKLLVIEKSDFEKFLESSDPHQISLVKILEDLVQQQLEREIDLLTESPYERYKRVKQRSPQLFQLIPNKHIANYLRMTPETLSRLKKLDFNQE